MFVSSSLSSGSGQFHCSTSSGSAISGSDRAATEAVPAGAATGSEAVGCGLG